MLRRLSLLLLIAAITACSSQPNAGKRPTKADRSGLVGQAAPDFTLEDVKDGSAFTLSNFKGKVVLLDFWATWCPPCRMSIPQLKALHKDYAGKDLEVVSISLDDDMDKVRKMVAAEGIAHRQLFAGDAAVTRDYAVRGIPMFVVVDKQGTITKLWTGFHEGMSSDWRSEIDQLLKQ